MSLSSHGKSDFFFLFLLCILSDSESLLRLLESIGLALGWNAWCALFFFFTLDYCARDWKLIYFLHLARSGTRAEKNQVCLINSLSFLFVWVYLFIEREREKERETEQEQAGEGHRERKREYPKQVLCCQHRAWCRAWSHVLNDHDLSRDQRLDAQPTEPPRHPFLNSLKHNTYQKLLTKVNQLQRFWENYIHSQRKQPKKQLLKRVDSS